MNLRMKKFASFGVAVALVAVTNIFTIPSAFANPDVRKLQTCLKEENSSLDVLVLMDSSRSLRNRDPKVDEKGWENKDGASDPDQLRGPMLKSSLKLLLGLANDSNHSFRINLKNFGDNTRKLGELKSNWLDWTDVNNSNSNTVLDDFVKRALYDDSHGTEWGAGLQTAQDAFNSRFNDAAKSEQISCPVMIWITDGAPTDRHSGSADLCQSSFQYSLDWYRSRNILVLGGLLNPTGNQQAREFIPIVDGSRCPEISDSWTQGTVIEATDASSLAWQFVALVAGVKNLIDLSAANGKFYVDKGTSHLEIFIRGQKPQWRVTGPNGKEFCSISNLNNGQCSAISDDEVGITTITIAPSDPKSVQGNWSVSPSGNSDSVQVFGGISTDSKASRLIVDPPSQNVSEGKDAHFTARLVNADGTSFDMSGYRSIVICAELMSSHERSCKSGATTADLVLRPSTEDSSVPITAIVTSSNGTDRKYNVSAVVKVVVSPSGLFPTLVCKDGKEGDTCKAENLKNKTSKPKTTLSVIAPTNSGATSGQIYLKEYKITRDDISIRGDGNFTFKIFNQNGEEVDWNNKSALFSPGDKLTLEVATGKSGKSDIEGIIRYVAVVDGKEIQRQLVLNFNVGNSKNLWLEILFVLLAYLLTVGIPYLYLLLNARKRAVLNPPFGEFAFLAFPFTTTADGKIIRSGASADGGVPEISHREFVKVELPEGSTSVQIENALVEVIPPKWNPFAETTTSVTVPQNLIFTTSHDDGIKEDTYKYLPSLIGEAIVYFNASTNLDPVAQTVLETGSADASKDIWGSSDSGGIREVKAIADGPINGRIIMVTQTDGNRKKAVQDVIDRLSATVKALELQAKVLEMRKARFEAIQASDAAVPPVIQGTGTGGDTPTEKEEVEVKDPNNLWGNSGTNNQNLWKDDNGSNGSNSRGLWD